MPGLRRSICTVTCVGLLRKTIFVIDQFSHFWVSFYRAMHFGAKRGIAIA